MNNIKNIKLINKLLKTLIIENGDKITLNDLTMLMDNMVGGNHELYPSFYPNEVVWNIEDHAKQDLEGFVDIMQRMDNSSDIINVCFTPKCNGCERNLKKQKSTDTEFIMNCNLCGVEYSFKVVHETKIMNLEDLDKNDANINL